MADGYKVSPALSLHLERFIHITTASYHMHAYLMSHFLCMVGPFSESLTLYMHMHVLG
jgi:hypothetical protein